MLISHDAIDTESTLITYTESALREDIQCLGMGRQHNFSDTIVTSFSSRHLINNHLRGVLKKTNENVFYLDPQYLGGRLSFSLIL